MRKFILGTDWWTDCDDAAAIRVLSKGVQTGKAELLGVVADACMPLSAPSLRYYLDHEGFSHVPLALDRSATDFSGQPGFQQRLAALGNGFSNDDCEEPITMLRRLLAGADDASVELIEIGFLQVWAAFLQSPPDAVSPLDGRELARKKVKHFWVMAGNYSDETHGIEHNFANNRRAAAGGAAVCANWPTPITFLGWEVGASVISGKHLSPNDPMYGIFLDVLHAPCGRSSWDPMTVEMALFGSAERAGYQTVKGHVFVDPESGTNSFVRDENGLHEYVIKCHPDAFYEERLERILAGENLSALF